MLNEAILPFPGTLLYTCFTVHVYTVFHYLASTPGGTHRKKTNGTAKEHLGEECSSRDGEEKIQMVPTCQMVQYLYQLKKLSQ